MVIITNEEIKEVTQKVIDVFVIPDYESRGHDASGQTKESFSAIVENKKGIIQVKESAQYLVTGSSPQQKSDEEIHRWAMWYGKNVFSDWVNNKGLSLNPYAVAYNIAKHGSKIYRDGGSTLFQILEKQEVKDFIIKELGEKIQVNITAVLLDKLKVIR